MKKLTVALFLCCILTQSSFVPQVLGTEMLQEQIYQPSILKEKLQRIQGVLDSHGSNPLFAPVRDFPEAYKAGDASIFEVPNMNTLDGLVQANPLDSEQLEALKSIILDIQSIRKNLQDNLSQQTYRLQILLDALVDNPQETAQSALITFCRDQNIKDNTVMRLKLLQLLITQNLLSLLEPLETIDIKYTDKEIESIKRAVKNTVAEFSVALMKMTTYHPDFNDYSYFAPSLRDILPFVTEGTVVLCDIDDTLVGLKGPLEDSTVQTISEIMAQGGTVFGFTNRPYSGAKRMEDQLKGFNITFSMLADENLPSTGNQSGKLAGSYQSGVFYSGNYVKKGDIAPWVLDSILKQYPNTKRILFVDDLGYQVTSVVEALKRANPGIEVLGFNYLQY